MRAPITTHVLDVQHGVPAAGIAVTLSYEDAGVVKLIAEGETDADGRVENWLADTPLGAGIYRLDFATGPYFEARAIEAFHPGVVVRFTFEPDTRHYHVPVLLSAFGYTTYRGS